MEPFFSTGPNLYFAMSHAPDFPAPSSRRLACAVKPPPYRSIPDLFFARVTATPDAPACLHPEDEAWKSLSWRETASRVRELACGLLSLGLSAGDRVAIVSATRLEWVLADLAVAFVSGGGGD